MREVETLPSVITDSGVFISGDQPDNAFVVNLLYGVVSIYLPLFLHVFFVRFFVKTC